MTPLTDDELNALVAELCGMKDVHFSECWGNVWIGTFAEVDGPEYAKVPNYCGDLNQIIAAVLTLEEVERGDYMDYLASNMGLSVYDVWELTHATARQRAEAFARVHGKEITK